jgi:hypothetical protein
MDRSFKERSSWQGCVAFGSATQVSYFPTLRLSPVIQVSGEEAIAPLDSVASVSTSKLRKLAGVSCDHSIEIHLLRVKHSRQIIDARKRHGGLRRFPKPRKHSCPICILIGGQQLVRPFRERILADQLEGFVQNSPIGENSSILQFVNCLIFSDLQVATGLHR